MVTNRNKRHKSLHSSDDNASIISCALSGTTGGALLGSPFGVIGGILGGLIGGFFTGYSGYRSIYKRQLINNNKGIHSKS